MYRITMPDGGLTLYPYVNINADNGLINNRLYPLDEYTVVPGITPGSEAHFSTGLPSSAKFADKLSKIYRSA